MNPHEKTKEEQAREFFRSHVLFCGMPSDNEAEARKNTETANTLRNAFEKALFNGNETQKGGTK